VLPLSLLLVAACATAPAPAPVDSGTGPAAAPAAPSPPSSPVVASVAGESITAAELRAEMERRGGQLPGQYQTTEQKRALLDEMIRRRALAASARAAGLENDPDYRAAVERMLVQRFEADRLEPLLEAVSVSEEEIAAYYEQRRETEYVTPARVRIAWIFVEVSRRADDAKVEERRQRAEQARREALALPADTHDFGPLALKYSDDPASRYLGGELGWAYQSQVETFRYGREVLEAAFALTAPGELSPVLRTEHGFALVRLVGRDEAEPTPLDKLRPGIRNVLMREKRDAVRRRFYEESLEGLALRIDEAALAAVEPPGEPKEEGPLQPPPLPAD
jgi:parvulin-like peptidyl-prolyl isomerase